MGLESYGQQDLQKYLEFAQTPEDKAKAEYFAFWAIVHAEYPELKDPDSIEPDPNSYRMMRIIKLGTSKPL